MRAFIPVPTTFFVYISASVPPCRNQTTHISKPPSIPIPVFPVHSSHSYDSVQQSNCTFPSRLVSFSPPPSSALRSVLSPALPLASSLASVFSIVFCSPPPPLLLPSFSFPFLLQPAACIEVTSYYPFCCHHGHRHGRLHGHRRPGLSVYQRLRSRKENGHRRMHLKSRIFQYCSG